MKDRPAIFDGKECWVGGARIFFKNENTGSAGYAKKYSKKANQIKSGKKSHKNIKKGSELRMDG